MGVVSHRGNRLIERRCISIGGASGVTSDIKIVVGRAIELLAAGVIAVHNHPRAIPIPAMKTLSLPRVLNRLVPFSIYVCSITL